MRRDKLFGNMFMRLAACTLMAFACAGEAWGMGEIIPKPRLNPSFLKWQYEQKNPKPQANKSSVTNTQKRATRLLASPSAIESELLSLPAGLMPTMIDFSYLNSLNSMNVGSVSGTMPSRYDLRPLTPVRHQDPQDDDIGTCWAQASVGAMETWLLLNDYGQNLFSVRNMVNREGWDSNSWHGGNFIRSSAYLLRWDGPVWESDDPYTNKQGVVNYSFDSPAISPAYHIQQARLVPARTGALDNDALKKAIMEFGGLYATMKLYSPYYSGTSTLVDYWSNKGAYYCTEKGAGHAVTLVGWDDTYSKTNFNSKCRPVGNGAWIVKDSYGVDLPRDNGYIYVSYYDTTFAYTESCAFPLIESKNNYSAVYQYDELGQVIEWGIPANQTQIYTSGYGANMFTAGRAEELAAIGFYATVPKAAYKIWIYTGCNNPADPSSGTLALEQSGSVDDYAGFYTVPLKNAVGITKGQRFSVVVRLSTPGAAPFSLEIAVDGYTSNASANSGESFFSTNGTDWYDFSANANLTYGIPANFCCKAYTKSATAAKPTLVSIAISSDKSSFTPGQTATFTCEALYSDSSKKTISPAWSITEGRNYATISSAGLVTAKSVTKQQRVTVKASYTEDDITKEDTWGFLVTIAAPSAPTGVTATQGTEASCVRVSWTAPSGATEYAVYRATANNSKNAQYLENVTVARYNDTLASPGVDYWYFIKAKNSSGTSGFSTGAMGWRKLSPPDNVTATDNLMDKVRVKWDSATGAKAYRVYRTASIDGTPSPISGWISATIFDDTAATIGITYYYYVVSAVDASGNRPSDYSIVEDGMRAAPVTLAALSISGDASITSGGSATYTAMVAYTDGSTKSVTPSWSLDSTTWASVSGGKVTAKIVNQNQTITLTATYSEGGKSVTGTKKITIAAVQPSVPSGLKIASQTTAGIVLTWNVTSGASSYWVYRASRGGTANMVGTATATTFTDKTATPGVEYNYSVSAVNGAGVSARSSTVTAILPLSAPAGVTATNNRTDGINIEWQPTVGATCYRVARATSKTGTKTDLGSWSTNKSYLDTSATAGAAYYYFVRAATSSSGANASGYSEPTQGLRIFDDLLSSIDIGGQNRLSAGQFALYTCTATYSNGKLNTVKASWSTSPTTAATIDGEGRLTAKAVSQDTDVMVSASFTYGGVTKTATKTVKILATGTTFAQVKDVTTAMRWPFAALMDIDYTLVINPSGGKAVVNMFGHDEDHDVDVAAKTLSGDGADGSPIAAGKHRLTWDIGADYPGFHVNAFSVVLSATTSPTVVPMSITILGLDSVTAGSTATYTCTVSLNDGTSGTVTPTWSITSGSSYASISSSGVLTAKGIATKQSVTIQASYTQNGTTVTTTKTVTVNTKSVTISFNPNGGTVSPASKSYVAYGTYGSLPSATRTGYTFAGWWTAASGGAQITTSSAVPATATTLYAHWTEANVIDWTIDANGALTAVKLNGATKAVIPVSVRSIGDGVFSGMSSLKEVTIPDGVTSIGDDAFYGCSGLTHVTIPDSVTSIGDGAFCGCSGMADASGFVIVRNVLYSYHGEGGSLTIPNNVMCIGKEAFYDCRGLTSVTIPGSVTSIGDSAFSYCSGLTSVTIGNGVSSIGLLAFDSCSGLTSVTIPGSVTNLYWTFRDCSGLTSVTILADVIGVLNGPFCRCTSLTRVTIMGDLTFNAPASYYNSVYYSTLESLVTYVTSKWTGPTDTWCGRAVVVLHDNMSPPSSVSASMSGGSVEYTYAVGPRIPARTTTTVTVSWGAVNGAKSYSVWVSASPDPSTAVCAGTVTGNSFSQTATLDINNATLYYWVKAVGDSTTSDFSSAASVTWDWNALL